MSNTMIYGTVLLAALLSKVAAHPAFYDTRFSGCEIPATSFAGHGAPEVDSTVTMTITQDGTAVMEFVAGEMYDIETPAYNGDSVNVWIHASAGEMLPADPATHAQASSCTQAAHSMQNPAPTHAFIWTAPATTDTVTISIAQAAGSTDNYHTATMDLLGGAAAPGAVTTGVDTDEGITVEGGEEAEDGAEVAASAGVAAATGTLAAAAAAIAALAM